jgi:hypothetical protein
VIYKISKKEYRRIKSLQKISIGFVPCLLFKLPDGTPYKSDVVGASGLKEIHRFQQEMRKIRAEQGIQINLLGLPNVL